ncbi:putative secreted protein (Por secretion system target) [Chitinophaga polysaccharea]|uniref:Putative secreted protein (Por secretion system target) n=1 Tax=Chitinophaga polysaccharea TaxID=1293035 RepID=A0A561PNF8_9BACT|nr:T9SS type A sorting domain-containing protein [Chitinophaga polysaccharea]TWF39653.1 putative secreted protein (Por secretion system target) [Chitinophaga polysaccharea]
MRWFTLHMITCLLTGTQLCLAQTGVYVPPGGNIGVHAHDTVAIFSDVKNEGRFGSLKGSVINFYGSKWENSNDAALPDENDYNNTHQSNMGGTFRFLQVKGINIGVQHIYGGYSASGSTGASFPNLSIGNSNNIHLDDLSDLKVRYNLNFETGRLLLNGWNLVVGNGDPGTITGYSNKAFVVTGSQPAGGFLFREQVTPANDMVVYPVGSTTDSYSPITVKSNSSAPKTIQARVFDNVYQYGLSGDMNTSGYTLKTWHVKQDSGALNNVTVLLQHPEESETPAFSINRDSSYVTRLAGGVAWDTTAPSGVVAPGTLTTGAALRNNYINNRTFGDGGEVNTFLSLASFNKVTSDVALFFEAYRETIRWVGTHWRTTKELNLDHYELQRHRENEDSFYTVARIAPHSLNGTSIGALDYNYRDDDEYDNWTYYRLKIYGRDGKIFYSAIKKVPWLIEITISPNPNNGNFTVNLVGIHHKLRMVTHDVLGRERDNRLLTSNHTFVSKSDLPAGLYILTFYDTEDSDRVVMTAKMVVVH